MFGDTLAVLAAKLLMGQELDQAILNAVHIVMHRWYIKKVPFCLASYFFVFSSFYPSLLSSSLSIHSISDRCCNKIVNSSSRLFSLPISDVRKYNLPISYYNLDMVQMIEVAACLVHNPPLRPSRKSRQGQYKIYFRKTQQALLFIQ